METTIKWIKFTEEKPKIDKLYLVYGVRIKDGTTQHFTELSNYWKDERRFYGHSDSIILYWSELPATPLIG